MGTFATSRHPYTRTLLVFSWLLHVGMCCDENVSSRFRRYHCESEVTPAYAEPPLLRARGLIRKAGLPRLSRGCFYTECRELKISRGDTKNMPCVFRYHQKSTNKRGSKRLCKHNYNRSTRAHNLTKHLLTREKEYTQDSETERDSTAQQKVQSSPATTITVQSSARSAKRKHDLCWKPRTQ